MSDQRVTAADRMRPEDVPDERACRTTGTHTMVWGDCAHAPPPEPHLSVLRPFTADDGCPSLGTETIPLTDLIDRIERVLRTIPIRLGPNAIHLLERGEHVTLSGGEYFSMAAAVAKDLIDGDGEQP